MSTSAVSATHIAVRPEDILCIADTGQPVWRRLSREEGRALETLSHALEYLIDSRAFGNEAQEVEAIDILKCANQLIFLNSAVVIPTRLRMLEWFGL